MSGSLIGWGLQGLVAGATTGIGLLVAAATVPLAGPIVGGVLGASASLLGFFATAACPWEYQPKGSFPALMLSYLAAGAVTASTMTGYVPDFLSKKSSAEFNEKCKDVRKVNIDGKVYDVLPEGCPTPKTDAPKP